MRHISVSMLLAAIGIAALPRREGQTPKARRPVPRQMQARFGSSVVECLQEPFRRRL
ncbi:MAG: hypothetical protein JW986_04260 [Methanotrichaceae archaeon]|nr:hypothetical protein [Methanotrichaceae archaeon]